MSTGKTVSDMITRIAAEMGQRTDLVASGQIFSAIQDAVTINAKERFRFNENQPLAPFTFTLTPGTAFYGAAADARIPQLYKIDYINYLLGTEIYQVWRAMDPEQVYLANQAGPNQTGQPELWAYDGDTIVFYPYPNVAYPVTVGGYMAVAGPTAANDPSIINPWMNDAERLIRARAKYELAVHVTRNDKMAAMMSPDNGSGGAAERYYNELKSEASKIRGTSRIRAMPF